MNEILITVPNEEILIAFSKWFENEGFGKFMQSCPDVECLATAEYPLEVGTDFYNEIASQAQFEIE